MKNCYVFEIFFSEEKKCFTLATLALRGLNDSWEMETIRVLFTQNSESKTAEKGKSEVKLQFRILDLSQITRVSHET